MGRTAGTWTKLDSMPRGVGLPYGSGGGWNSVVFDTWGTWYALRSDGVYWSADGGENWERQKTPDPGDTYFGAMAVAGDTAIVSVKGGGAWRTTDAGRSWQHVDLNAERILSLAISGDFALAHGVHALYRSTDRGATWKSTSVPGVNDSRQR